MTIANFLRAALISGAALFAAVTVTTLAPQDAQADGWHGRGRGHGHRGYHGRGRGRRHYRGGGPVVYVQPRRVYVQPAPVYVQPPTVVIQPGRHHHGF